jgi:hypothetical protein
MSSKLIAGDSDFFANLVRLFIAQVIWSYFVPILWILVKLVLVSILDQAICACCTFDEPFVCFIDTHLSKIDTYI